MSERQRFDLYRCALIAGAAVAACLQLAGGIPSVDWVRASALVGLGTLALAFPLQLRLTLKISVATAVFFAAAVILPPGIAATVAAASELGSTAIAVVRRVLATRTPPPASAVLSTVGFNTAQAFLVVLAAGSILHAGGALAAPVAAAVMLVLNDAIVSVAVGLRAGSPPLGVFFDTQRKVFLQESCLYAGGYLCAALAAASPAALLLVVLPAVLVHLSLRRALRLKVESIRAVEQMADTVDRRDPYTFEHSRRVARYAVEIGRRLGFSRDDLELLRLAGAVHDIGKIAVPDAILLKPGPLTEVEEQVMRSHPRTGYEILAVHREYARVRELVLTHHERFDGTGYPAGLLGGSLPLLAQVLPVADTIDAMTSARPYRRPLPWSITLAELERGAGTQWNADVVAAALDVFGDRAAADPAAARSA